MKILMVASENDAFPGGKVGGIGDVIRDIPQALKQAGHNVDVVLPAYGVFSALPNTQYITHIPVMFAGKAETVAVYKVMLTSNTEHGEASITREGKIQQWVLDHPLFAIGGAGKIYCNDDDDQPFATDANKFALFSAAVAKSCTLGIFGDIDRLHLHDWHSAMVAVLRRFDPEYAQLKSIPCIYTIHNLALQGIRPLADNPSSLATWFPNLAYQQNKINDPRYPHCFNPMRAGITLSDKVHTVSPNYASEILKPSKPAQGFFGGEGLHGDLQQAADEGRLKGILNGCEYPENGHSAPENPEYEAQNYTSLWSACQNQLLAWIGQHQIVDSSHLIALTRLSQFIHRPQPLAFLVTSIGRITEQKMQLLQQKMPSGNSALDDLLQTLGRQGALLILGSGDIKLERFLTKVASRQSNLIFLRGYSQTLSDDIYQAGDLFLMPSSFEPCGISQMLAMRAGQPCLAHRVGGLADTIIDNHNGFLFDGETPLEQAENMLKTFKSAITMQQENAYAWSELSSNAAKARFLWQDVAQAYVDELYS